MKLVHVNERVYTYASQDPSADGGAERYLWLLSRALVAAGWSVSVGVRGLLAPGARLTIDGVDFVGLDAGNIPLAWYRFLVAERPDWWYWACASHALGPAAALAKLAGVGMVFSVMHDRDLDLRQALWERPRWWPLYVWGLAWSDHIFLQHTGQHEQLAPRWRAKASLLPGIVSPSAVPVKPHAERRPYVVWVAVLRELKRPDLLIEIARQTPDLRFVVCGGTTDFQADPGYGERMVAGLTALPNVEYLGQTDPEKTLRLIADASVLLLTSDGEGFPSVFLEAWTAGTPVVSLHIDPDGLIEKEGLGAISKTVESAIDDIRGLMNAPQQREAIAHRARRFIAASHSAEVAIDAFERALSRHATRGNAVAQG